MYNFEAEQSVLGSLLTDNSLMDDINLTPDDFYIELYGQIFTAIQELTTNGKQADLITVKDALRAKKIDIKAAQLIELTNAVATTANVKYHARIVKEKAAKRRLLEIADGIKQHAAADLNSTIEQAIKDIEAVTVEDEEEPGMVADLLPDVLKNIDENNQKGGLVGITTGFSELNKLTGGWQGGRYYILGARPKMGKTSLFCQIADIASNTVPTVLFSLEMTKQELVKLLIYQNAGVDSMLEQTGQLGGDAFRELTTASECLYRRNLYIDDRARTIQQIKTALRKIQKQFDRQGKGKIGLVVIDYVQLIHGDNSLSRNYQLEEISRSLKEIAKDFNVCVLGLSQLSRSVEQRNDKRPLPSDLRDSGSFEQDVDGLMLMYRDAYYNGRTPDNTKAYKWRNATVRADIVDINMFLNRHGAPGVFQLDFMTDFRKFVTDGVK